ncbi:TPA: hypothetical protein JG946_003750 [Enterobacter hormaechei subsp. steigerwaltii]|nr:hypothetical protein [Enterobacter hormaechei subsp. steigerwaltii]
MELIKNIPSQPDVEVIANSRMHQVFIIHNIKTGHTLVQKEGKWFEGVTDTNEHWGEHIDDAAGFHHNAELACTTPVDAPATIDDLHLGVYCHYNVVEESRMFEGGDFGTAYLPGIGRVVPKACDEVIVYPPNNTPTLTITGDAAEIITGLLSIISK